MAADAFVIGLGVEELEGSMLLLGSHHIYCEAGHGWGHVLAIDGPNSSEVTGSSVVDGLLAIQLALLDFGLMIHEALLYFGETHNNVT